MIHFQDVLQKAYELESTNAGDNFPLVELYKWTAEQLRGRTHIYVYNPGWEFAEDAESFIKNAEEILSDANNYFETRIKKEIDPDFKLSDVMPPEAIAVDDGVCTNFKEFRGGVLKRMESLHEKYPEKYLQTFSSAEIDALNAVTWAYHFSKTRTPLSYFIIK